MNDRQTYTVANIPRVAYAPFARFCKDRGILIKDALAEAVKMWLDSKNQPR